jgi:serine/threonine protein phosphatase 1
VVDLLASDPLPGVRCHFLRGNHEQAMLDFLQDPIGTADWLQFGGMATLDSYGVRIGGFAPSALMAARDDLISRLPGGHWDWLANLPLSATYGDYLFVHAGVRPGVPLDRQSPEDLMTIRAPFLEHRRSFGARVVHGHTITPTITVLSNRIGIDTGAYATGVLSAIRLTGIDLLLFEVKRA